MHKKVWVFQAKENIRCFLIGTLVVKSRVDTQYKLAWQGEEAAEAY